MESGKRVVVLVLCVLIFILSGCLAPRIPEEKCTIIFEDNPVLFFSQQSYTVERFGHVSITVGVPKGKRISAVSYENYSLSSKLRESENYDYYTLTLHQVRYSAVVRLRTDAAYTTTYHPAEGMGQPITVVEESAHLYFNTLPYRQQFTREGYIPIGWNTQSDGTGISVGFGSRFDHTQASHQDLYIQWLPCTPESDFSYETDADGVTITGYHGSADPVIPAKIGGVQVKTIAAGAFRSLNARTVVLPDTVQTVEEGAFCDSRIDALYFFDSIAFVSDDSFSGCEIQNIHIQAVKDPVYSGSYFDTFPDKMDYLASLQGQKKMILFCGSSARFGYDSPMLEKAFATYRVANMGVYAYSNMRPQAELILQLAAEGDILLSTPELDAIEAQFCGSSRMEREFFCMVEGNYDLFSRLDCRNYTHIFSAFQAYNEARQTMAPRSYLETASSYDEDGKPQLTPSYNLQGDYILYREDNLSGKTFGIKRAYYNPAYINDTDIDGLNRVYDAFAQKGVRVLFAYSPRSRISISQDSTPETIAALDAYLRQNLHAPVVMPIAQSLMDPLYFYGTDNHLSTNGVKIYTQQMIDALKEAIN